jgi:hypothetical protein
MTNTEGKKKYEVWTGRWDEPLTKYASFEAESDEEALKIFKKYEEDPALTWNQVTLFPVTIEQRPVEVRGKALKTVREPSGDDALDLVG